MNVDLRPLGPDDVAALHAFFAEPGRCQLLQPSGFAALHPGVGGSSHVASVTLVVAGPARRQGLGRALARQMLIDALEHGFKKVTVETAANNGPAVRMFRNIGFEPEALLRDHFYGRDGALHDIVILAHVVDETWSTLLAAGIDEAVG